MYVCTPGYSALVTSGPAAPLKRLGRPPIDRTFVCVKKTSRVLHPEVQTSDMRLSNGAKHKVPISDASESQTEPCKYATIGMPPRRTRNSLNHELDIDATGHSKRHAMPAIGKIKLSLDYSVLAVDTPNNPKSATSNEPWMLYTGARILYA